MEKIINMRVDDFMKFFIFFIVEESWVYVILFKVEFIKFFFNI